MSEPLARDTDFIQLRMMLGEAARLLQKNIARSRYTYDVMES
jgi:hypothetical protein